MSKLNVVLDLDQTLIYGMEMKNFEVMKSKNPQKVAKFEYKIFDNIFVIFARPGLQKFLDFLFYNFNVSVWTAASKAYALFIVNNFILTKPNRQLDFVLYSEHCDMSKKLKRGLKGLSVLWDVYKLQKYNQFNTVIIDANP